MKLFSSCSGPCCTCISGVYICLAGHNDNFYHLTSKEELIRRLNAEESNGDREMIKDALKKYYGMDI